MLPWAFFSFFHTIGPSFCFFKLSFSGFVCQTVIFQGDTLFSLSYSINLAKFAEWYFLREILGGWYEDEII